MNMELFRIGVSAEILSDHGNRAIPRIKEVEKIIGSEEPSPDPAAGILFGPRDLNRKDHKDVQ